MQRHEHVLCYLYSCTLVCLHKILSLPLSLCSGYKTCSFLWRQKLWEETKSAGMKATMSVWENILNWKALLLYYHGNGEENMCWSHSLKVTQYLHVLIIPPLYERNITSLVSMMKIHIRSFQPVYLSSENREPAVKVKIRKWTAHILVSLTKTSVDEAWFQTITWIYYFRLDLFKWVQIG